MAEPQPLPTKAEPNAEPAEVHAVSLNKGGIVKKSQKRLTKRTAKDLIEKEWKIVDKLQSLADKKGNEHQQAFYYQTLASHVRTLSMLLKLHGQQDQSQDLAKLLSEIDDEATKLAKRLKQR
jgi:23S rRNA pseudoU1915 N3-methylase RlmH